MRKAIRTLVAFVVAALVAATASSIFSTQMVIAGLQSLGVSVPLNTRLIMTFQDFAILQTLLPVVAACYLVGFLLAALGHYKLRGNRLAWYVTAGGSALLVALLVLSAVLQLMPVAGARTAIGLLTQTLAGAIGGYVFSLLTTQRKNRSAYRG
ncbi:MAG: hypothetical protein HKN85_12745 [Gammaproteobacteria bacterium]|nr:hypothetical protein [Gammaproteobacteria bacterium]